MARALSTMEIDVVKSDQLEIAVDIAKRHLCPAIVISPELATSATLLKGIKQAAFKIIAAVDLPRGEFYGREKFRGFPTEAMGVDGFEILLTHKQQPHEIIMEIEYLQDFCRKYFGIQTELRFVLDIGQSGRNSIFATNVLTACKKIPLPTCIRTTHMAKIPPSYSAIEAFKKQITEYQTVCNVPVKLSGNINWNIMNNVNAFRFGVSLQQAQNIIAEVAKPKIKPIPQVQPIVPPISATA